MIDTHTHLYAEEFDQDRKEVIERAKAAGVEKFFLPAIDSETHAPMLQLESEYPGEIFAMMGLYPCSVTAESYDREMKIVQDYLDQRKFCAIGEIGIDFHWDKTTYDLQVKAFEQQIQWAKTLDIPIVIHTRDAWAETFEVVERNKDSKLRGIFHCFSGTLEDARRAVNLDFMLGIGGVLTFKNGKIDQFLNQIPLSHIVLETDAPYLAPTPFRGKRNESAYVKLVLEKLAVIYNRPIDEVERITTENALKVFQI